MNDYMNSHKISNKQTKNQSMEIPDKTRNSIGKKTALKYWNSDLFGLG